MTLKELHKIYEKLENAEELPSFLFSFEHDNGYKTISYGTTEHYTALIFSLIENIKQNNPLFYIALIAKLTENASKESALMKEADRMTLQ